MVPLSIPLLSLLLATGLKAKSANQPELGELQAKSANNQKPGLANLQARLIDQRSSGRIVNEQDNGDTRVCCR